MTFPRFKLQPCLAATVFLVSMTMISCVSRKEFEALKEELNRTKIDLTDSDGDGVIDMLDWEPDSPSDCPVDTRGITLDSDGDGLMDCKDYEPYSPPGYGVDERGVAMVPVEYIDYGISKEEVFAMMSELRAESPDLDVLTVLNSLQAASDDRLAGLHSLNLPTPEPTEFKRYTASHVLPLCNTYHCLYEKLTMLLQEAGYTTNDGNNKFNYFWTKEEGVSTVGLAITTDLEFIGSDGIPVANRWEAEVQRRWWLLPQKMYSRVFVFLIVEDVPIGFEPTQASMSRTDEIMDGSAAELNTSIEDNLKAIPVTGSTRIVIMLYEFEGWSKTHDNRANSSPTISFQDHLRSISIEDIFK